MDSVNSLKDIVQVIGGLLIIAAAIVVVIGYGKAKNTEQALAGLRADRDDLTARVTRLESEKGALAADNTRLHQEVTVLKDMVTNREVINSLVSAFEAHDAIVTTRYEEHAKNLDRMYQMLISQNEVISKALEGKTNA